jgi:hypothetical protein
MSDKFFVSFNSPQCGWMSIGFEGGGREFHTTTAHAPHESALPNLLDILTDLLDKNSDGLEFLLQWNRDPEEFDFWFKRRGKLVRLEIWEYPTGRRMTDKREKVFEFEGDALEVCQAFYATFAQMREDIHVDEFESNWRQPFPEKEFTKFEKSLKNYGQ